MWRFFRITEVPAAGRAAATSHPFDRTRFTAIHPATSHPLALPVFRAFVKRVHEVGILRWRAMNHRHQAGSGRCPVDIWHRVGAARP